MLNRCDFRCVLKVENVRDRRRSTERLFQARGLATAKVWLPMVEHCLAGTRTSAMESNPARRHQNFSHGEQPCANPKFETKVIRDSNTDFWINPDPDFRWICPKMLWMHYRVGVSHFAKYGTKHPFIVREMLTNLQKSHIPKW